MIYPKIPLAQSVIEICHAKGVQDIIISPGSRNAPLTIGFTNNPKFSCYSIADERCAAFFALGIAQQTKRPVAVVCTSGSALLNYYPALAEAFYSQVPFIVISADRPFDKIDIGDGQTIRQENVFINHSLYNANLTQDSSEENNLFINEAINVAIALKGPVHINVPFEEPLYETTNKLSVEFNVTDLVITDRLIDIDDIIPFSTLWNQSNKILILVGECAPNSIEQKWLDQLAAIPSIVIMTEATSNLHHPSFINNIDTLITPFSPSEFLELQPNILITFGGMIVSKRVKAFLRKYKPRLHWHIDEHRAYDTFGILTKHFQVAPNQFFKQFLPFAKDIESDYKSTINTIQNQRKVKHGEYLAQVSFCDLKAFEIILSSLFKIILINNGGGGIFRILPGHQETETFNTFFETSHCLTAEHLAKMYQLDYTIASDEDTLKRGLSQLYKQNEKPMILEVFTPTRENDKLLNDYFKALV
jgi:2-succinyl-5-enolpyruvyl-6-hydroxy-3-cyclohexene-1-carboxylate synthase